MKEGKEGKSNLPITPYRTPASNSSIPGTQLGGIKRQARPKRILYQSTAYTKAIHKIKDWLTPIPNIFRIPADKSKIPVSLHHPIFPYLDTASHAKISQSCNLFPTYYFISQSSPSRITDDFQNNLAVELTLGV